MIDIQKHRQTAGDKDVKIYVEMQIENIRTQIGKQKLREETYTPKQKRDDSRLGKQTSLTNRRSNKRNQDGKQRDNLTNMKEVFKGYTTA